MLSENAVLAYESDVIIQIREAERVLSNLHSELDAINHILCRSD